MRVWKYLLQPRPLRVECKMISNSMYADGPSSPVLNGSCAKVPHGKSGLQTDRLLLTKCIRASFPLGAKEGCYSIQWLMKENGC